jgi:F-type H+-transporting ATPase subunit beta
MAGECDTWQESSLYMVGALEEARQKELATAKPAASKAAAVAGVL